MQVVVCGQTLVENTTGVICGADHNEAKREQEQVQCHTKFTPIR